MKNGPQSLWGIYLVDRFNNRTLITAEEGYCYLEPVLLEPSKKPAVIPNRIDLSKNNGNCIFTGYLSWRRIERNTAWYG